VAESPPPLPQKQTRPEDIIFDEAGEIPLAAKEHPESDVSQQPADSPDEWTSFEDEADEDEAESKPAVDEPDLKSAPESGRFYQELEDSSEMELIETFGSESVPDADATQDEKPDIQEPEEGETISDPDNVIPIDRQEIQTETVTDDSHSPPEPEVVDKSGDETSEPENLAETKIEPIENETTPQASASPSAPEMPPPLKKSVEETETKPVENIPFKKEADLINDAKAGITSKSLDDTIVLEVETEVEPVASELLDTTEESTPSEPRAEAQKKNMPKADLTKAQALKKQKVALVKAQALKKQKLVLAKAAALKRKKAVQAKAQANIVAAKKKVSAAAAPTAKSDPGPKANSRMQTLLEKYKGRVIGINYDNSADIRKAHLVEANAEYFSVFVKDQNLKYSYPLKAILSLIEGKDGVEIEDSKQLKKFIAVIKVYPLVLF
jgi:hypothetical protein